MECPIFVTVLGTGLGWNRHRSRTELATVSSIIADKNVSAMILTTFDKCTVRAEICRRCRRTLKIRTACQ